MIDHIWLVIALPLLGVLINGLLGYRLSRSVVNTIGVGSVAIAFIVGLLAFIQLAGLPAAQRSLTVTLWPWVTIGNFALSVSLLADPLSLLMVLIVTGVGLLIHIYSTGYMLHKDEKGHVHEDPHYARFFTFMNLFIASMLILVLGDNYLMMYVGWELVGLCSYLLIGFWFHKPSAAEAGKKAFIVTRIGDVGFAIGVFLIWTTFGTLQFTEVFRNAPGAASGVITAITLLLFLGAVGKSAQLPLYIWLPDAMEGPTPVSALIHAATMVTAGVYMIARSHLLYSLAPTTSFVVAVIGAATALFAATIALTQNDLKRILAYSTISQLGYMFLAVGAGAYAAGMFHLTTHAFFKALLFLAAGSVMHALHDVIDIQRMGGLKAKMPATYWTFLVGGLALAGFPLFSGFFSKDEILLKAYEYSPGLYAVGLLTALLTAFYTFRAFFKAFHGTPRDEQLYNQAEESSRSMTVPLAILAAFALAAGLFGLPAGLGLPNSIDGWLGPVFADLPHAAEALPAGMEMSLLLVSALVALLGIFWAYVWYIRRTDIPVAMAQRFPGLYRLLVNKYFIDELYMAVFVNPLKALARFFAQGIDRRVIDGALDGGAGGFPKLGRALGRLQSGYVSQYATATFIGALLMVIFFYLR